MKTLAVLSLGCKVNDYESIYVIDSLKNDFKIVDFNNKADVYVIFSCCVTNTAEAKTRKMINKAKRLNNDAYICVVGCYPQTKLNNPIFKDIDLLIGSKYKDKIPEFIKKRVKGNYIEDLKDVKFESMFINDYPGKSRAFLKIQDGCNQYCSYCIIPYARGNERSEDHNKILKIANDLSKNYKEIVLTGIHTGRYNDNGYKLIDLLKDLIKIDNLKTIRLSSIEMNEIDDEIIDLMSKSSKIAHHLHIPVQSLNDNILNKMNRPYSLNEYKNKINNIRNKINDISISTDLIVGFAYENDNIFNSFFKELDDIKFSFLHVFPYSIKTGTKAASYDSQIDEHIKKERVNKIYDYQNKITFNFNKMFIDKNLEVLIENNDGNYSYGYSKNYIYTKVKGVYDTGDIISVHINDIIDNILIGEYVSK